MSKEEFNPIYDLNSQEYNLKLAEALKNASILEEPEWIKFVKSSPSKERPIDDPMFFYKRTASIMKQIYKKHIVGVERLRVRYGSKKSRGSRPEEFRKSGGKIIRVILQQLDKAGLTELVKTDRNSKAKPGRKLTKKGREFMEGVKQ